MEVYKVHSLSPMPYIYKLTTMFEIESSKLTTIKYICYAFKWLLHHIVTQCWAFSLCFDTYSTQLNFIIDALDV